MKLVEILARELKEWPVEAVAIAQDYDGSAHPYNSDDLEFNHGEWGGENAEAQIANYKVTVGGNRAEDYSTAIITRAQWQEARDSLNKPAVETWNGEGLPPVGMHVVVHDDGSLVYGHGESGKVLAHVDGCAVIRMSYGLGCFLPRCLRTPEQIQQEERENTIAEMACIVRSVVGCGVNFADMAALYDAGFRRQ